jgi:hypothetical protein
MLGDFFGDDGLGFIDTTTNKGQRDTSQNLATYLEKPELPRGDSGFVGFFNQYL